MRNLILIIIVSGLSCTLNSQMVLSGSATGSCDCYTLTDAANQAGSIWSPTTIDLTNEFDFLFEINAGSNDVWGADGMSFALRQSGTSTGSLGNGLGYEGITPSIGIEVDTWNSSPTVLTDIDDDHLAMNAAGDVNHLEVAPIAIPNIEDGLYHDFRITWDPVLFELEVFLDGISYLTYTGDIVTSFFGGNPNVYFGWSGGTGGVFNEQSVCLRREALFSVDPISACVGQELIFTDESTSDLNFNSTEITDWNWDFGDGSTSIDQNPIHVFSTVGTYTVSLTITDISGCTDTFEEEITITEELDIDIIEVDLLCFDDSTGEATAIPLTGTGPYTYQWNDPEMQITETAENLPNGTYEVTVIDNLGCPGSAIADIAAPPALLFDAILTTNAGCGVPNGTISLTGTGGVPPYEFSIDDGVSFFGSGDFMDLSNGSYEVVIRDANGCTTNSTVIVGLDSPLNIDDVITTDVTCGPFPDGTILINASAGVAPLLFSIDDGASFQVSNYFENLLPGEYEVVVEDDAGCSVSETVIVGSLSSIIIDDTVLTEPSCKGETNGEIEVFVSGGTAPYEFSFDGGGSYDFSNNADGLSAGTFDIVIRDAVGCTAFINVVLNEPDELLVATLTASPISCFGLMDGFIEIIGDGGTPAYSYAIDGSIPIAVGSFNDLGPGTYDVEIVDENGCTLLEVVEVLEPEELAITDVVVVDVTCNGTMDGEITVSATGGTGAYEFSIDGFPFQVSPSFTGLEGGTKEVVVRDENGCTAETSVEIDEADPIIVALGEDTTICLGGSATLCPEFSGGTGPYSFIWDGTADSECLSTATIGIHELQIEDVNGCTSEIVSQQVNQYTPLSVFSSSATTICPGDEVVLSSDASGEGPEGYTYTWTNNLTDESLDGPIQTVYPTETTLYTITVSSGCEDSASANVLITTFPIPNISFTVSDNEGCEDLTVDFYSTIPPSAVSNILWDFGDGNMAAGPAVTNTYYDADCFDVNVYIETVDGCELEETFMEEICVWKMPVADFSYLSESPDLIDRSVSFQNESEFASIYQWYFGDGQSSTDVNPTNTYPELGNSTYEITLVAETDKGCRDVKRKNIKIDDVLLYFIPNAFTPNADLFNQSFKPIFLPGFYPKDFHFVIFNRWGEIMWESYDMNAAWDGTYGGEIVDDGVYLWKLTFRENASDKKHIDSGHITILK